MGKICKNKCLMALEGISTLGSHQRGNYHRETSAQRSHKAEATKRDQYIKDFKSLKRPEKSQKISQVSNV